MTSDKSQTDAKHQAGVSKKRWATYAASAAAAVIGGTQSADAGIQHVVLNDTSHPERELLAVGTRSFNDGTFVIANDRFPLNLGNGVEMIFQHGGNDSPGLGLPVVNGSGRFGMVVTDTDDPGQIAVTPQFKSSQNAKYGGYLSLLSNLSFGQDLTDPALNLAPASQFSPYYMADSPRFKEFATAYPDNPYAPDPFGTPGDAYIGFSFNDAAGAAGQDQYGWVRLTVGEGPLNSYVVEEYAFGMPGEAVSVGQVPEPGSLAMLALGALGLAATRRRREPAA